MKGKKKRALPEGWREVRLGDVGSIYDGTHQTPKYVEAGVPFFSVENITSNNFQDTKFIEREIFKNECSKVRIEKGDILMTRIGDIGTPKYVDWDVQASFYVSLALIKPSRPIDSRFLSHYILGEDFQKELWKRTIHVAFPKKINLGEIGNCKISFPPLSEQKAIASLLETWDTAIEKTEALIAAKEKQFKWLLKRLISDQHDNPEWRNVKLGDLFGTDLTIEKGRMLTRKQMKNGDYPVVAGGQGYMASHNEFTHKTETITISSSGAYAGFVWFHNHPIFATDCNVITAKKGKGITKYFYYVIRIQQERLYGLQSGGAQPHIYAKDIATLHALIPPLECQKQIVCVLNAAQKEIDLLKQLAGQYRTQKRGLMQRLLTGEWRIHP